MTGRESQFHYRSFVAQTERERVLLAEIARLRQERDEARDSADVYLSQFKSTFRDYLDLKEPDRAR